MRETSCPRADPESARVEFFDNLNDTVENDPVWTYKLLREYKPCDPSRVAAKRRESLPTRRLIVTDRPDLDSFWFADAKPGMWKVIGHFYVQLDYSVRMGIGQGRAPPDYFVDVVREGASR